MVWQKVTDIQNIPTYWLAGTQVESVIPADKHTGPAVVADTADTVVAAGTAAAAGTAGTVDTAGSDSDLLVP